MYAQERSNEENPEEMGPNRKRRNIEKRPEEESSSSLATGANTPVAEKIKRYEKRIIGKNEEEDKKILPTLRSFIDLRSGLKGTQRLPEPPGNQEQGGRDLASGNSVVFGEERIEKDARWPDTRVLEGGNKVGR